MTENQDKMPIFLDDRSASGKKRNWAQYKTDNSYLAIAYDVIDARKAERLRSCANVLTYGRTEGGRLKLINADFCRVRLCPICQWRRSLKNYSHVTKILDAIGDQYEYIFLTLTVKNCKAHELYDEITHILKAFKAMSQYKRFMGSIRGWYRGLEVTHNIQTDEYHPHIHALLAVPHSFFTTKYYIKQAEFTELWKKALRIDYTPIVDVRRVKGNTPKAIAEVAKYAVKPSEILYYDDWDLTIETVRTLDTALAGRRLVAFGGVLKDWHKKLNLDDEDEGDLNDIGEGDGDKVDKDDEVVFVWHTGYCQYVLT